MSYRTYIHTYIRTDIRTEVTCRSRFAPNKQRDLYPGLAELCPLAELLPGVDVGVLGPLEGLLELVELVGGEGGTGAALLPLEGDARLRLHVGALLGAFGLY